VVIVFCIMALFMSVAWFNGIEMGVPGWLEKVVRKGGALMERLEIECGVSFSEENFCIQHVSLLLL
jgi:hypothetical protein